MGIKGTVRRNQDGHFIHANVDLDIIITEEVQGVCIGIHGNVFLTFTDYWLQLYFRSENFCCEYIFSGLMQ